MASFLDKITSFKPRESLSGLFSFAGKAKTDLVDVMHELRDDVSSLKTKVKSKRGVADIIEDANQDFDNDVRDEADVFELEEVLDLNDMVTAEPNETYDEFGGDHADDGSPFNTLHDVPRQQNAWDSPNDLSAQPNHQEYSQPSQQQQPPQAPPSGLADAQVRARSVQRVNRVQIKNYAGDQNPLDQMMQSMLGPMIQDWLNKNIDTIVKTSVDREVGRITRRK